MPKIPNKRPRRIEHQAEDNFEDMEEFYEFKKNIIPELRKLLLKGAKHTDIIQAYVPHLAARLISIALANPDDTKALAGIKECLDRVVGKSTEHRKVDHQFSNLTDKELDALLKSELSDIEDTDDKKEMQ